MAARGRVWAPAPTSLYFLPFRMATHQGGPACPSRQFIFCPHRPPGRGQAPPLRRGCRRARAKGHAAGYACGVSSCFPSVCDRSPGPARPSLSAPAPHRHRHGCCMPWRSWIQLDGLVAACDRFAIALQVVEVISYVCMIDCTIGGEFDCPTLFDQRLLIFSLMGVENTPVVIGSCAIGVDLDGLLVALQGLLHLSKPFLHIAQGRIEPRIGRFQLQRLLIIGLGLFVLLQIPVSAAPLPVKPLVPRRQFNCLVKSRTALSYIFTMVKHRPRLRYTSEVSFSSSDRL